MFFPIWIQKSYGNWTTYGGGGFWYFPNNSKKNSVYAGWLLQYDFSKILTLGGELYYQYLKPGYQPNSFGYNFGGFVNFTEEHHLIFTIGKVFSGGNYYTGYFGYLIAI
jgi:hypothetical protein